MKNNLLIGILCLGLPLASFGQEVQNTNQLDTVYTSGDKNAKAFTNSERQFRDWAITVGGGAAFMHSADITSFYDGNIDLGWNAFVSLDKQISHAFGVSLMYSKGKTNQKAMVKPAWGVAEGSTEYDQLALIGDLNISNLLRRVENKSFFNWALHAYAGAGVQGFHAKLKAPNGPFSKWPSDIKQTLDQGSIYWTTGVGLKYNLSKLIDIELRTMYVFSGDDAFDGSGVQSGPVYDYPVSPNPYMNIHDSRSDNSFTVNLGLSFKIGKHDYHLAWYDPMRGLYNKTNTLALQQADFIVCKNGDQDNDAVCDDWDRELDTPAGARVDGAGVALDTDLDGVIDLYDKCVTVPGSKDNEGCPVEKTNAINTINKNFEGIEFALDSDKIRKKSYPQLNQAADVIKSLDKNAHYLVIGATDTRGSEAYNQKLSQRRASAVVKYLVSKGVDQSILTAEGHGEKDLKYPECLPASKCPEWKNEANRRVYFRVK